jgi:hypothetical protein
VAAEEESVTESFMRCQVFSHLLMLYEKRTVRRGAFRRLAHLPAPYTVPALGAAGREAEAHQCVEQCAWFGEKTGLVPSRNAGRTRVHKERWFVTSKYEISEVEKTKGKALRVYTVSVN